MHMKCLDQSPAQASNQSIIIIIISILLINIKNRTPFHVRHFAGPWGQIWKQRQSLTQRSRAHRLL